MTDKKQHRGRKGREGVQIVKGGHGKWRGGAESERRKIRITSDREQEQEKKDNRKRRKREASGQTQFKSHCLHSQRHDGRIAAYQFSLLIWSPKPGVSMTVSFILTPFSSMSAHKETHTVFYEIKTPCALCKLLLCKIALLIYCLNLFRNISEGIIGQNIVTTAAKFETGLVL